MPQKSILMSQNLFFDSNLKLRIGRLTLEDLITLTSENMIVGAGKGEHKDPRRRPTPTLSGQHEVTHGQQLCGSSSPPLSLSLASLCPSLSQLYLPVAGQDGFFVLPSLLPSSLLRSSFFPHIKREKSSVLGLHKCFAIFLLYVRCLIFIGWQKTFPLHHNRT
jgi:hypothetical protein